MLQMVFCVGNAIGRKTNEDLVRMAFTLIDDHTFIVVFVVVKPTHFRHSFTLVLQLQFRRGFFFGRFSFNFVLFFVLLILKFKNKIKSNFRSIPGICAGMWFACCLNESIQIQLHNDCAEGQQIRWWWAHRIDAPKAKPEDEHLKPSIYGRLMFIFMFSSWFYLVFVPLRWSERSPFEANLNGAHINEDPTEFIRDRIASISNCSAGKSRLLLNSISLTAAAWRGLLSSKRECSHNIQDWVRECRFDRKKSFEWSLSTDATPFFGSSRLAAEFKYKFNIHEISSLTSTIYQNDTPIPNEHPIGWHLHENPFVVKLKVSLSISLSRSLASFLAFSLTQIAFNSRNWNFLSETV